jgi:hypothetical protein
MTNGCGCNEPMGVADPIFTMRNPTLQYTGPVPDAGSDPGGSNTLLYVAAGVGVLAIAAAWWFTKK